MKGTWIYFVHGAVDALVDPLSCRQKMAARHHTGSLRSMQQHTAAPPPPPDAAQQRVGWLLPMQLAHCRAWRLLSPLYFAHAHTRLYRCVMAQDR